MKAQPLIGLSATDPIGRGQDTELEIWVLLAADWSEMRWSVTPSAVRTALRSVLPALSLDLWRRSLGVIPPEHSGAEPSQR